ncbi:MAG TPA: hypothetical protein VFA07_18875 [Chthonomonadaceae bacterium]|nr:hypothetical protein [Chthonomonadaceae bacterium]
MRTCYQRLLLAWISIGLLGIGAWKTQAQDIPDPYYTNFDQASVVSGFRFQINGSAAAGTDLSNLLGTSPDIQVGFLNQGTNIDVHINGPDSNFDIGAGGGDIQITGIDAVYLIQNTNDGTNGLNSLTANISSTNHAILTTYSGSSTSQYWGAGAAYGANFPFYQDGGFVNNTKWLSNGNVTSYKYGDFHFYGLQPGADGSNASGPIELGLFAQSNVLGADGKYLTGFLAIAELAPAPEPAYIQLGGLLALGGLGPAFRLLKKRRKA